MCSSDLIKGKTDTVLGFNDNTYGVVDFKTSNVKDGNVEKYSRQLHAYSLALENAEPGKPSLKPISRIIAEEFTNAQIPLGMANQGISMFVPTLLELGTEDQKKSWIEKTIKGEVIWCQGYSEPGSGSDLASLQTKAVDDGDDFIINGQKIWTSSAQFSDMMFCLVRTEPDAPKHKGISYILIDMKTPGIDVRPLMTMTGHAEFNEVFFTDVRVPKSNIVGKRGEGWNCWKDIKHKPFRRKIF